MRNKIKIRWTGDARTKLGTRYIESRLYADEEKAARSAVKAMDTLTRQKTQVVIESEEEAKAFMKFLERAVRDGNNGRTWTTPAHYRAFKRVKGELIDQLKQNKWLGYEPDEFPNGYNWNCPDCGKEYASGDNSNLFCLNCKQTYSADEVES